MKKKNEKPRDEAINEPTFNEIIFHSLSSIIYQIELRHSGDISVFQSVWLNQRALDFIRCTQDEITVLGFDIFRTIVHPHDLELMSANSKVNGTLNPKLNFFPFIRIKPPCETEYTSFYCIRTVLERFDNGTLKKVLVEALEVNEHEYADNEVTEVWRAKVLQNGFEQLNDLSKREKDALHLILEGWTDAEIADKLFISLTTAKKHRNNMLHKTGAKKTVKLAVLASKSGKY